MKFKMYFGWLKTLLISIVIAGTLAVTLLDICMLIGVNGLETGLPAVAGVSLVAAVIICVAALLILFNSFYRFADNDLEFVLGFFRDKVNYENIIAIKQNSLTNEIFIVYKSEREEQGDQTIRFNLSQNKIEGFLAQLRKACPFVIVETFTPEPKNKDKK